METTDAGADTRKHEFELLIISGPSGVGKSPLVKAFKQSSPRLSRDLRPIVLYNSRAPRPGEVDGQDYHFRNRREIESLRDQDRYIVMEVRNDLQALDTEELQNCSSQGTPFFEGNVYIARTLLTHKNLKERRPLSIFISPLSSEELTSLLEAGADLDGLVTDLMRRKLLRRTHKQKGLLSAPDLDDIETRAGNALREMKLAYQFQYVIPNHDGEDSDNWEAFDQPLGDARRTLECLTALVAGREPPPRVEQWSELLLKNAGDD